MLERLDRGAFDATRAPSARGSTAWPGADAWTSSGAGASGRRASGPSATRSPTDPTRALAPTRWRASTRSAAWSARPSTADDEGARSSTSASFRGRPSRRSRSCTSPGTDQVPPAARDDQSAPRPRAQLRARRPSPRADDDAGPPERPTSGHTPGSILADGATVETLVRYDDLDVAARERLEATRACARRSRTSSAPIAGSTRSPGRATPCRTPVPHDVGGGPGALPVDEDDRARVDEHLAGAPAERGWVEALRSSRRPRSSSSLDEVEGEVLAAREETPAPLRLVPSGTTCLDGLDRWPRPRWSSPWRSAAACGSRGRAPALADRAGSRPGRSSRADASSPAAPSPRRPASNRSSPSAPRPRGSAAPSSPTARIPSRQDGCSGASPPPRPRQRSSPVATSGPPSPRSTGSRSSLGRETFRVVAGNPALGAATGRQDEARADVVMLHAAGFLTDARRRARDLEPGAERRQYLSGR